MASKKSTSTHKTTTTKKTNRFVSKSANKSTTQNKPTLSKRVKSRDVNFVLDELSIFYPAYNEEGRVGHTIEKTFKKLPEIAKKYEVLIINDGSKDNTEQEVKDLQKKYKQLRIINHDPNKGYGEALKTGFYETKYEWVAFTDVDGQFEFDEISDFIKTQKNTKADLVIGYYKKREVPIFRKINTFIWQKIVFVLFGLNVRDIDCAFKLINRKVIQDIGPLESGRGAFISSEFLIKSRQKGFKMIEIPVTHYARSGGKGTGANFDVIIQSFIDLFKLWSKTKLGI